MRVSVALLLLGLVALALSQCTIISGDYICNNSPRVYIDLDSAQRSFTAVYPGGACTYSGSADVNGNGDLVVSNVLCSSEADCRNNVGFSCNDFVVSGINYFDDQCLDWSGSRGGKTLTCIAQFDFVPTAQAPVRIETQNSAGLLAPVMALLLIALI